MFRISLSLLYCMHKYYVGTCDPNDLFLMLPNLINLRPIGNIDLLRNNSFWKDSYYMILDGYPCKFLLSCKTLDLPMKTLSRPGTAEVL